MFFDDKIEKNVYFIFSLISRVSCLSSVYFDSITHNNAMMTVELLTFYSIIIY